VVQALEGVTIVDLSKYAPGPYCTMILGDLGADVILIEEVGAPTGRRAERARGPANVGFEEFASPHSPYNPLNRNKRSMGLNLKTDAGRRVFYQLTERADVVVEGYRPGVAKRLGVDYPVLRKINEKIIYCAITGYGQDGPYRDLVGHDINYLSLGGAAGMMSQSGVRPPIPGNLLGDMAAGGMQAAVGILAALMARERTGSGQFVDISMTDGVVSLLSLYLGGYFEHGRLPEKEAQISTGATPLYRYYKTKDGKFISIACAAEPWFYANLCKSLDCEHFLSREMDPEMADELGHHLEQKFLTKTRDEWFEFFHGKDIPIGKVYALDELATDRQLLHREMFIELDHPLEGKVKQPGISVKLSETPGRIRRIGPALGEHTREILTEMGYGEEDIGRLQKEGAIPTAMPNHEPGRVEV
jgi:crotonobetainyl-CoA:carnitine CoA-transferase CaiB-like acyl-CoA transferase